ncbi:hypothetical protein CDL12_21830 [Handroanthus impetiginosus]|uniref:Non-specific serine/threonine protein kinase n=1 Tax=Handroanthus impetiginosus TaxID=429701 RepID=A0A2G9GK46_9LAMI|nr:hypothetical protein CDL12_21830 [Handroanthus impetiginosus]
MSLDFLFLVFSLYKIIENLNFVCRQRRCWNKWKLCAKWKVTLKKKTNSLNPSSRKKCVVKVNQLLLLLGSILFVPSYSRQFSSGTLSSPFFFDVQG